MKGSHVVRRQELTPAQELTLVRRVKCTLLRFWTVCRHARCRRARACTGDADACFVDRWREMPGHLRVFFHTNIEALFDGASPQEAKRQADAEVERWMDVFRAEAEREDAVRFPRDPDPPPAATAPQPPGDGPRRGPRIRSL